MPDEYEEIQRIRELWSKAIMTWSQIFVPLTLGVFSVGITQYNHFADNELGGEYLIVIGILYWVFVLFWQLITLNIDKAIVSMYPRLLELEKVNSMELFSSYYFNNIKRTYRNKLADWLKIKHKSLKSWDFRKFKSEVIKKKKNPYDLLLDIWDIKPYKTVKGRGHFMQIGFLLFFGIAYFIVLGLLLW